MVQLVLYKPASCRSERGISLIWFLYFDKLTSNPLYSKVRCHLLVTLASVCSGAWHMYRLVSKAFFSTAESLYCSCPRLATTDLSQILIILLWTWYRLYTEDVLWSLSKERCCVCSSVLLWWPALYVFDRVIWAWTNSCICFTSVLFISHPSESRCCRIETLLLLALGHAFKICVLLSYWVAARSS